MVLGATGPFFFISYRRDDTAWVAGRLRDHLTLIFGPAAVFQDTESIRPGAEFAEDIRRVLRTQPIVLALIGPSWEGLLGDGSRRIDEDRDLVRREIAISLTIGCQVIPLFVDDRSSLRALPVDIEELTKLNAVKVRSDSFGADLGRLLTRLWELLPSELRPSELAERIRAVQPAALDERPPSDAGHAPDEEFPADSLFLGTLKGDTNPGSDPLFEEWLRQLVARRSQLGDPRRITSDQLARSIQQLAEKLRQRDPGRTLHAYLLWDQTSKSADITLRAK